jgi:putative hemolysin
MPEMKRQKMVDLKDLLGEGIHLPTVVLNSLEKFLGLDRLNVAYDRIVRDKESGSPENFFELATKHLNLKYQLRPGELDRIPRKGPVVVVANHPHGLSDGLMIGKLLTKVREDVRIVANEQLTLCGELAPWMITVDVYDGPDARMKNFAGIKQMISWLNKGGLIAIFPAGTASSYSIPDKHVTDDAWNNNIASIIRRTKATVVPLYIPGRTSLFFQGISLIKREARVAFLPREVGRDSRCVHKIVIGKPISGTSLSQYDSDQSLISHLRLRTYLMGRNYDKSRRPCAAHHSHKKNGRKPALIPAIDPELLRAEVASLPESCRLHRNEKNGWEVYLAEAGQIPSMLQEIGRLRELTFRAAGEGSGLACDLDEYDPHYKHLILWDSSQSKIAGAYRMGLTDEILNQFGIKGLYNGAFFSFSPSAIEVMKQGVEMGRAFIVPEYQKLPLALGTLWIGIGQFLVKNPQYRYLYGTVSISRDYTNLSRTLIVSYLEAKEMDSKLSLGVRAFNPPHRLRLQGPELRILPQGLIDPQGLSQLVSDIEQDGKGLPVLLRHYLKLNGKILSFNIDKSFGDVLDCLILVDIYKSPERSLRRFMGSETYEELAPFIQEALRSEAQANAEE